MFYLNNMVTKGGINRRPIIWQSGSDNKEQGKNKPGHVRSMAGRLKTKIHHMNWGYFAKKSS